VQYTQHAYLRFGNSFHLCRGPNPDADTHSNGYRHGDADSYGDGNTHSYTDGNCNRHGDANVYTNGHSYSDAYCNAYSNTNADA
jgi:hypothetical protein